MKYMYYEEYREYNTSDPVWALIKNSIVVGSKEKINKYAKNMYDKYSREFTINTGGQSEIPTCYEFEFVAEECHLRSTITPVVDIG